jgi:hypothetical protein
MPPVRDKPGRKERADVDNGAESTEKQARRRARRLARPLARSLAERVRREHGKGAKIERLILLASVTEEDGSQVTVVEADEGLPLSAQADTLRHALSTFGGS